MRSACRPDALKLLPAVDAVTSAGCANSAPMPIRGATRAPPSTSQMNDEPSLRRMRESPSLVAGATPPPTNARGRRALSIDCACAAHGARSSARSSAAISSRVGAGIRDLGFGIWLRGIWLTEALTVGHCTCGFCPLDAPVYYLSRGTTARYASRERVIADPRGAR